MKMSAPNSGGPTADDDRLAVTFGRNVRLLRESRGFTGPDFAVRAGIGKGHLSAIENHGLNVSLATINKIATALDLSPADLFEGPLTPATPN